MRAVAKSVKCKGIKSTACNFDNSAALIGVGDRRAHRATLRAEPPSKSRRLGEPLFRLFYSRRHPDLIQLGAAILHL